MVPRQGWVWFKVMISSQVAVSSISTSVPRKLDRFRVCAEYIRMYNSPRGSVAKPNPEAVYDRIHQHSFLLSSTVASQKYAPDPRYTYYPSGHDYQLPSISPPLKGSRLAAMSPRSNHPTKTSVVKSSFPTTRPGHQPRYHRFRVRDHCIQRDVAGTRAARKCNG
jgi:hypothetical protein